MARNVLVGLLASLALSLIAAAHAQNAPPEYQLDIPQLPLVQALQEFSTQTRVGHGYLPASSAEEAIIVGPLKGRYTVDAALTELLKPTGLSFFWSHPRVVSIGRPPATAVAKHNLPPPRAKRTKRRAQRAKAADSIQSGYIIDDVLVAASRLRKGFSAQGAAPVEVMERQEIEQTGAATISELLKYLSQQPYLRSDGFRSNGAQYAELRGLGEDTTLVLINGRRAPPSAASFTANAFDLNTVPLSAVERVEVLLDSGSVEYGADAIGGIVNIVLREHVPDPAAEVRYGGAEGGADQYRASAHLGYERDNLNTVLMVDYFKHNELLGVERGLWCDQDFRRYGSLDQRSLNSSPGNITVSGPAPLFAAVSPDGGLLFGQRNYESLLSYFSIAPKHERIAAIARADLQVSSDLQASAEMMYVERGVEFGFLPPLVPALPVPDTNPFNPLGVPVIVNARLAGMERQFQNVESTLLRGVGSLSGNVSSWKWELSLLRSEEDADSWVANAVDPLRLLEALAVSDPDRALNVFRAGPAASEQVLAGLLADPRIDQFATEGTQVGAVLRGPVLPVPAGEVTAVLGSEWRSEAVQFDPALGLLDRDVGAAFAELRIPLLSAAMQVPAVDELTLTVGGRFDDYSDFGGIFNPQYELTWQPYRDLSMRASYGRSFRAPSLYELFFPPLRLSMQVADTRRGEGSATVPLITGGNTDLEATRGESFSAGFAFSPQALDPLKLTATYWRVVMDERVTLPQAALLLANEEQFADRVLRDAPSAADAAAGIPGRLRGIDASRMNSGGLVTSGIDVGAAYELASAFGRFSFDVSATWVDQFETVDLPAMPAVDRLNVASVLGTIAKWRAVATVGWRRGAFGAVTHLLYVPAYDDTFEGVLNGRRLPSQTIFDMQASLDLGELIDSSAPWRGMKLTAGASNLLDQQPHFAEVGGPSGYDTSQGDLRGRFLYLQLGKIF